MAVLPTCMSVHSYNTNEKTNRNKTNDGHDRPYVRFICNTAFPLRYHNYYNSTHWGNDKWDWLSG